MKPTIAVCSVPVSQLDLTDTRYLLSPRDEPPAQELVASIRKYGLLRPPLVQETDPGHFVIVAGRKRTKAFRTTTIADAIPCLVAPRMDSDLDMYELLIEYIYIDGSLSIIEQIAFLERIVSLTSPDQTLPFLSKLGHKANNHTLHQLLALRNLSSAAQLALHEGIITFSSAGKMLRLARKDQIAITRIIRQLRLGGSKQQQLIQMSTELIMRRNRALDDILADCPVPEKESEKTNIPQRTAALLKWLQHECSPELIEAESLFRKRVARLELTEKIQILHSPAFEDDRVKLSIDFPDWQSMQLILPRLQSILLQPEQTP